jgi:diguanylate cyclase (GGDEF)-like protein
MRLLPDGRTVSLPAVCKDDQNEAIPEADAVAADANWLSGCPDHETCKSLTSRADSARALLDHRLQVAISQMSQGFAMFGADQRLMICNDAFRQLYALPPELACHGALFWDILDHAGAIGFAPPAHRSLGRAGIMKLITDGIPWRGVGEMCDGRVVSTMHEPLPDGGWISMQEDVTTQRRREEAEMVRLREAEAQTMRFNAAVNNMSHGLSLFDGDKRLVVCNETYARLYGLPEELTRPGTPFIDIFRHRERIGLVKKDEDVDAHLQGIESLIATGGASKGPVELKTGQVVMINHQPLADGGWLATHEDITEQHRNAEIIRFLARHDSLTRLPNRASFLESLSSAERQIEDGAVMAVFCVDVDRFKEINDSLGHGVGDAVLTGISGRMLSVFDGRGITARLGGDEFAALIGPLHSAEEVHEIARALLDLLGEPLTVGNATIICSVSIGIALAPHHGHDANVLMRCADLALCRAKLEVRGGYSLFETRMDVAQRRRQSIENGLRSAIRDNGLNLMFQPLVAIENGRVSCCEALLRWQSPELGLVSPAEFISVAEETGLIREIGVWALEAACMEATNWPCHVRVAVNVSPVQFRGDDLVGQVKHALMRSGLEPSRLELEITESLFLADDAHNLEVLHRLREFGVRFALDDFGTGYSSLAYMLKFPFDKVKIDRAIVSTIAEKPETVAMVTAIVELCKGFNMLTVAEGIESEEQLAEVTAHGCSEVQGYIFSPPLPHNAIGELLRRKQILPGAASAPPPYVRSA